MLAHYESFEFCPHGDLIGVLFLVALVAIFFLVVGAFSQSRRNPGRRAIQAVPSNVPPRSSPVGVCQRCRSALSFEAAYCGRCGLPVTHPTPIPLPQQRSRPGNSRWLIYAIIALLGLVGFGAFWFMSDSEPAPAPPVPQQPHRDTW